MNIIKPVNLSMKCNEIRTISSKQRVFLHLTKGAAWVTATNDMNDYVLSEGHEIELLKDGGELVLQVLSEEIALEIVYG